ncbi:glycosyltransferase involved in cell wall biosynthesis [Breznakibacter xylanolyticus]|uniref:Glycosyltransferase involved in cell wall biosynthesis n=1 Tax=Breznakibacter xylanolyticus TaxID=990 RepID=A0A2W7NC32_9BACT|nr:glycosyltransferase [Breznakibacter xylanolyticus]PZX14284.1 glycosyltransferase involved in cell wall biosynthesis [Breznakibacter xylanolyticus]
MKRFLVVSYAIHKQKDGRVYSYAPYVREMNIWLKHADLVRVVAPFLQDAPDPLDMAYVHPQFEFVGVKPIDLTSLKTTICSVWFLPKIIWVLLCQMYWADHIHLRCPGNMGLIGLMVQVFFPKKNKTVKYANNWDPRSRQPLSYRIQKKMLRNSWLTRRCKVLVYGDWREKSRNIIPFYTASYTEADGYDVPIRSASRDDVLQLLFVGTLTSNKRPHTAIQTVVALNAIGIRSHLTLIGDGAQKSSLRSMCDELGVNKQVAFTGKLSPAEVVGYFKASHFLVFMSWSEGWPKVVAESMWWGCVPVSTDVSCVRSMLGDGQRGIITDPDAVKIAESINVLVSQSQAYQQMALQGMEWSRQYHLGRFERDVSDILLKKG